MGVNSKRVEDFCIHESSLRIPNEAVVVMPSMEIHSVCLPPKKTTFEKLKQRLGEIFFPDDPLYRFKNQTWPNKLLLGLQFIFPVFQWGPEYGLKLFRSDIISGLTIASLAIPQVWFSRLFGFCMCFFFPPARWSEWVYTWAAHSSHVYVPD